MIDLKDRRSMVMKFYEDNADVFTQPPSKDCLFYAFEEFGEIMRAHIKAKRPGDLRRQQDSNLDIDTEIGDYKFMLLAASLEMDIPGAWPAYNIQQFENPTQLSRVVHSTKLFWDAYNGSEWALNSMLLCLYWHTDYKEDELELAIAKLTKRCEDKRLLKSKYMA